MRVNALDHVNISTSNIAASVSFYAKLLGLEARNVPGDMSPDRAQWLYDHAGHAIIHLVKRDGAADSTGPIDHIALNCSGKDEMLARLQTLGIEFSVRDVDALKRTLIFTRDPHGVLLELNFRRD